MVFGIWTLQIDVFGGFSLADVMFHIGDTGVTYGMLVALAAVGWIVAINEIDGSGDVGNYILGIGEQDRRDPRRPARSRV